MQGSRVKQAIKKPERHLRMRGPALSLARQLNGGNAGDAVRHAAEKLNVWAM